MHFLADKLKLKLKMEMTHKERFRQSSQRNRRSLGRAVIMRRMKTITAMITAEATMTEKAMGPMMTRKMMTGTRTMMMLRREV